MPNRREFLAIAGTGLLASTRPDRSMAESARFDETWLTYAPDAEAFWKSLPLLDRLRKIAEAGFTRYEFGSWKTKDIDAVAKRDEELGIQPSLFLAYRGIGDPKRKEAFLDAVELSVEVAQKLGSTRLAVSVGDKIAGVDREEQVDAAIDALKAASEKVAEAEITLLVDPFDAHRDRSLFANTAAAADVIKEVDSKLVRLLIDAARLPAGQGDLAALVEKHKAAIGHCRLIAPPASPRLLKLLRDSGFGDPLGIGLPPRADPLAAIEATRKADADAKAL